MSRIFPDPLQGRFPPGFAKVYRSFKGLSDEKIVVWVSLPFAGEAAKGPDFLVVVEGSGACLVAVSEMHEAGWEEATGQSLFGQKREEEPGSQEAGGIRRFLEIARGKEGREEEGKEISHVGGAVVFPNIAEAEVRAFYPRESVGGIHFWGRERLGGEGFGGELRRVAGGEIGAEAVAFLRSDFTPESVVPRSFSSSRRRLFRGKEKGEEKPLFLDYDQEDWTKRKLQLSEEGEEVVVDGEAALVTGVAGSGKSLVLLFRACVQARLAPASRSLVLTHNKALKNELQSRFGEIGNPQNVRWATFYSWLLEEMEGWGWVAKMVSYGERDELVRKGARLVYGKLKPSQVEFLSEEFDWMQDSGLGREGEYLVAERFGRGVKLGVEERKKVFSAYRGYREELAAVGGEDWSGLALRFWRGIEAGKIGLKRYDFIYIDEAQFFAPVWFRAIKKALKGKEGKIFFAADPTQGFLKRRQSWAACGFDLRGRSTRLRKSYRNTKEILEFAARFYRSRIGAAEDGDEINLPGEDEIESAPNGAAPHVFVVPGTADEIRCVVREVVRFCSRGGDAGDVLILAAGKVLAGTVLDFFVRTKVPARDAKKAGEEKGVRVCGLDAATGLEAPVVFLVGAASILEEEEDWTRKEEQRKELKRDNTKRLYMGFTRAACHLVVTWSGEMRLPACMSAATNCEESF